ncbi:hemolysin family protein [Aquipuribacter sp. MA13-6]|uniref:hemolysin family protein n=1 Tax=unclassified Aquipuribacter TaxID=2635084 RepID=UPI003EECE094
MSPATLVWFGAGLLLVLVAAWFAAAEAALARVTRGHAEDLQASGRRKAKALRRLLEDTSAAVNTSTFGRIVCETAAVAAVVVGLTQVVGADWVVVLLAGTVLAALLFVLVGACARTIGQQHADAVALGAATTVLRLGAVTGWLIRALVGLANVLVPGKGLPSGPFASEAELIELVEQAEADSVIERDESLMLQRVVHLGDTVAREVQVPRPDMVTLDSGSDLQRAMRLHLRSGFSRIPVTGRDADDVLGISYLKDVAAYLQAVPGGGHGPGGAVTADDVMRAPVFVPESKAADDLLREMQAGSVHLAVVIDEYGGVSGLVTIEDLLEEIVGQISDEYDREDPEVEQLGPDRWRLSARTHLTALGEITQRDVEDDEVDTVAGLLAKHLGKVPIRGSSVDVSGLRITADRRGRRNRLLSVVVERLPDEDDDEYTVVGDSSRRGLRDDERRTDGRD